MTDPVIAQKSPFAVDVAAGKKYWWCACGRSKNQPFCDGSHKGTGLAPQKFELTEKKKVALCNCKHSNNKPFCDGSHRNLP